MAVLASYQRYTRFIGDLPFGDASAGDATINSDPNSRATASGTSGATALTIGSAILANGDYFIVHQTRGTGVGQWEVQMVASGGGTTSITCGANLQFTYGTGAQVIKTSLYGIATLASHTVTEWNGSTGGVEVVVARTSIGGAGTIAISGGNGAVSGTGDNQTLAGATGGGFRGGSARNDAQDNKVSNAAEGSVGAEVGYQNSANGSGGGGGGTNANENSHGGGGGGHAASGSTGGGAQGGVGGGTSGMADGTEITFGGGGGGSWVREANTIGSGASGGGIIILISAQIDVSGLTLLNVNGGAGGAAAGAGGGGGAGGAALLVCQTAVLGTNKITATGGSGGANGSAGGDGSVGRITVQHSDTVTGTTNPTFTDVTDGSLVETLIRRVDIYGFML